MAEWLTVTYIPRWQLKSSKADNKTDKYRIGGK